MTKRSPGSNSLPQLSESELAELLASLKQAEDDIRAGNFFKYDSKSFKEQLLAIYRDKRRRGG
jgi:hypothetical protein